ncbi:MAG: hypothetical protein ACRYGL_02840 [Janthinobacterium lividum]
MTPLRKIFRASLLVLGCGATLSLAAQENTSATPARPPTIHRATHATHATRASPTPKSTAAVSGATEHGETVWQSPSASASGATVSPDKADPGFAGMGSANARPDSGASVSGTVSALKKPY